MQKKTFPLPPSIEDAEKPWTLLQKLPTTYLLQMSENNNPTTLNIYGDEIVRTTGTHGADISIQRMDDLDKKCISLCLSLDKGSTAIDLGCGLGIQGVRFALLGLDAFLIDFLDISETIESIKTLLKINNIHFINKDLRTIKESEIPSAIDLLYSQRFIHYLEYNDAKKLIKMFANKMQPKARAYFSASGMKTELSKKYKHKDNKINARFHKLDVDMAEKHDIKESVCLYHESEFESLFLENGFKTINLWSSEFGNVKGIFEKLN